METLNLNEQKKAARAEVVKAYKALKNTKNSENKTEEEIKAFTEIYEEKMAEYQSINDALYNKRVEETRAWLNKPAKRKDTIVVLGAILVAGLIAL
jgi:hypothetical protein